MISLKVDPFRESNPTIKREQKTVLSDARLSMIQADRMVQRFGKLSHFEFCIGTQASDVRPTDDKP